MIFADLHNHTNFSDGDFSPEKLIRMAKKSDVKAIGVTDHDTLAGLDKAVDAGKKSGIEVIPGVEVSIRFKRPFFKGTLHVLCYFSKKKLNDGSFKKAFWKILENGRGDNLVKARLKEINRVFGPGGETPILSKPMVFEEISFYSKNASRRHFALALQEKHNILEKDTRNLIIGNESPAYLPSGVELAEVANFIKKYKVLSVLAHPAAGSFPGGGHYKEVLPKVEVVEKLLPEFLDAGIKGIEVYYPGHDSKHEALMLSWASQYNLLVTGGSDCHDEKERPFGIKGLTETDFLKFKDYLT